MKAIVTSPICPLMTRPSHQCRRGDEALFGMTLEVLEATRTGWYQVEAPYRYGGYAPAECLLFGDSGVRRWADLPKQVVCKAICDVLSGPAVEFWPLVTLTRGALVSPVGAPDEKGWQRVVLPDGREGYTANITKSPFLPRRTPFGLRSPPPPAPIWVSITAGAAKPPWASTAPASPP